MAISQQIVLSGYNHVGLDHISPETPGQDIEFVDDASGTNVCAKINVQSGQRGLTADKIHELTSAAGVTIDGLRIKDGGLPDFITPTDYSGSITYGAGGSMTFTSVTTNHAEYVQLNDLVIFSFEAVGTTGGTENEYITASLPVATTLDNQRVGAHINDVTVPEGGFGIIRSSPDNVRVYRTDRAAWQIASSRLINCTGLYWIS